MIDYHALIQRLRQGVGTIDADRNAAADAIATLLDERQHLQQKNAVAWNEGHAKGARELKTYIQQADESRRADAWGNSRLTEALLEVEAQRDKLKDALLDALPYVEDVLSDPDALACFKPGTVERHAKAIRAAIAAATT